jgi:FMN phosphatase YigB (HAD superfamily)
VSLTILIDLDDTLLDNSMDKFIPAYLGALGTYLSDYTPPDRMVATMLAATQKMFANNRPDRTLKETFDPEFYPNLNLTESGMRQHLDLFYATVFPNLCSLTKPRPDAIRLIEQAFQRGYRVGIATNPLFPRTAIIQRLEWAGLSPEKYSFSLIPSYETFHYTKPNPAFFAEFLGRIGWPREPIIMIGNDPEHDLIGGHLLGMPVFLISNGTAALSDASQPPEGSGKLSDVIPWIDSQEPEDLILDYASISAMLAVLRGAPAAFQGLTINLPGSAWKAHPQPGEWGLTEIACHLRDVEREVNLPRLTAVLQRDNPIIEGIDTDTWAEIREYSLQDGPKALGEYVATRIRILALLDELDESNWNRPARHTILGPTTLRELVRIMGSHERLHLRQVYNTIHI